ncbi:MAG: type II toxin-antitoxin system HicA family toxin [Arenimonas sp.]
MSRHSKALVRIQASPTPSDLKWEELQSLLEHLGYQCINNHGSRRKFVHEVTKAIISLHNPHPSPEVGSKCLAAVVEFLKCQGHI